jgi:5-methylcytosine-specific restriction endonuclease McrA
MIATIPRDEVPVIKGAGPRFRRRALMVMHFMKSKGLLIPGGSLTCDEFIRFAAGALRLSVVPEYGPNRSAELAWNEAINMIHDTLPEEFRRLRNLSEARLRPPSKRSRAESFFQSDEWRRVRYEALKNTMGCCQCCGARGQKGKPLHVDHIKPRSKFPALALVLDNLQVLCEDCNVGKGAWDQTDWRKQ